MIEQLITLISTNPIAELGAVATILIVMTAITKLLKQPILIWYILTGIIISPSLLHLASDHSSIETFAHLGVALLLFMVGLSLNPNIIKDVWRVAILAGLGQIVLTSVCATILSLLLGFDTITSIYISIALTFSSTIIVVKLISDNGDTQKIYGKIALGILIIQDLIAMIILMAMSTSTIDHGDQSPLIFSLITLAKWASLLLAVRALARYVLKPLTTRLSSSQEALLLFGIARCLFLGTVFSLAGFSTEIGTLLAGISLASSPYRFHIMSKMKPLRDFFVALFFVSLGSQLQFANAGDYIIPILILSVFVLIGKPMIVMRLMGRLRYTKINNFMTGITMAQISEFSFIVITLAISTQQINNPAILTIVAIIGIITMTGSSYFFNYASILYRKLSPYLHIFDTKNKQENSATETQYEALVIWYNRLWHKVVDTLLKEKTNTIVIEYDPTRMKKLVSKKIPALFGDASDIHLLEEINLSTINLIISSVDNYDWNITVLKTIKGLNPECRFITFAHSIEEAEGLYKEWADYVIIPHILGAEHISDMILNYHSNPATFAIAQAHNRHTLAQHKALQTV